MLSRITRGTLVSTVSALLKQHKIEGTTLSRAVNGLHTKKQKDDKNNMSLILYSFANIEKREKETYLDVLRQYKKGNELRRGHVEFIKIALKYMDEFGVNHDLAVYKALLDVLPKGKFVPFNWYQTITLHYPLQQKVAIELLEKMEYNCVIPDYEMQQMLINIFGVHARVLKKFWRMMYWMPKFANLNPWPCPRPTPRDPRILAKLAIYKISSVDPATHITEYEIKKDIENAVENTWIISAMSISQKELLAKHPLNSPIFVEGPYLVWVANQCIDYFLLRADATTQKKRPYEDIDDVSDIRIPFWDNREIIIPPTVHEQSDGTFFAVCATGTSTKDSLLYWIRCLQKHNPILISIPVIFKLASSTKEKMFIDSEDKNQIVQTKD
ncbi:hypothetical protein HN011_006754 [Eciton burchellii]|nr:hypothetical protein HN011_006754 [Eciton burchellii]